jgi:copper transport protein
MVRGVLAMVVLLAMMHGEAFAHASLVRSEPAADARLDRTPERIRLVFSEPVEAALARISIVAADGHVTRLSASGDPQDVHAIVAPLDALEPGAWRVMWRVVSADGHPVEGTFVFRFAAAGSSDTMLMAPPAPATALEATWGPVIAGASVVPALARGLALGALLAAAGLLLFIAVRGSGSGIATEPALRAATWLSFASVLLLGAHLLAWTVNAVPAHRLESASVAAAFGTLAGRVELARTGLALLMLWALALARRPRLAAGFACAAVIAGALAGHPAAIQPLWTVPAKALHLVAAATWMGGLLWLVAVRGEAVRVAAEARVVSSVALASVVVVAVSGVVQTALFLPSPADLVRSAYGLLVLAKLSGFAVLVGFGAHHRYRVLPRLATGAAGATGAGFIVTLRREVAVMAVVVMLGGWLAYTPPPSASHSTHSSMVRT